MLLAYVAVLSLVHLPIEGLRPRDLSDTFNQGREGHKHEALDILAPRGTPVLAVAAGKIAKLFLSKPGGLTIYQFDEAGAYCFYYAHLDRYEEGLREGDEVLPGQRIGYVGTTGNAPPNVPHLHFTVFQLGPEKRWWQGTAINPYPYLLRLAKRGEQVGEPGRSTAPRTDRAPSAGGYVRRLLDSIP